MPAMRRSQIRGLMLFFAVAAASSALFIAVQWGSAQAPNPVDLERGARLYVENCAACHGEDGQGRKGATLAKNWPSIRPEATIKSVIERGIEGSAMPAWAQANGGPLSQDEIDALVAYILDWETGGPRDIAPLPTSAPRPVLTVPPNVEGDANRGAVLFDRDCAFCHGREGQGRVGARLAKDWPSIRPDLNVRATISSGIQGSVMPAWSQTNGGPLSETEIDDLVAFVLTLPAEPIEGQPTAAPPVAPSPLAGWPGVLLAAGLFLLVVAVPLLLQRGRKE